MLSDLLAVWKDACSERCSAGVYDGVHYRIQLLYRLQILQVVRCRQPLWNNKAQRCSPSKVCKRLLNGSCSQFGLMLICALLCGLSLMKETAATRYQLR